MPERSFGRTVRYRRTKIGLSQAKLGDLVGRSASTVRSWERDASTPADNEVIDALAAVLAIDPRILYEKAGMQVPDIEQSPTVEQALATLRPDIDEVDENDDEISQGAETEALEVFTPPPQESAWAATPTPRAGFFRSKNSLPITPATPPMGEPSYIEDEGQRQLYRVRTLATIVLLVALAIIFIWALGNAVGAIGAWWDDFVSRLRI